MCPTCKDRNWRKAHKFLKSTKPRNEPYVTKRASKRERLFPYIQRFDQDTARRDRIISDMTRADRYRRYSCLSTIGVIDAPMYRPEDN